MEIYNYLYLLNDFVIEYNFALGCLHEYVFIKESHQASILRVIKRGTSTAASLRKHVDAKQYKAICNVLLCDGLVEQIGEK